MKFSMQSLLSLTRRGSVLGAAAAMLLIAEAAVAVPLVTDLKNAWLFDTIDQNGYVHDEIGNVRLISNGTNSSPGDVNSYRPVKLVREGTLVATGSPDFDTIGGPVVYTPNANEKHPLPAGATPFEYATNQAGYNDWYQAVVAGNYPNDRTSIFAVPTDLVTNPINMSSGAGAISMWLAPIRHDIPGENPATSIWRDANLFEMRGSSAGRLIRLGTWITEDNVIKADDKFVSAVVVLNNQSAANRQQIEVNGGSDAGAAGSTTYGGSNGTLNWSLPNPNTDPTILYNGFPTTNWTSVIVNWGAGTMQVYVDGVIVGDEAVNMSLIGNLTRMHFASADGNFPVPMAVDELAFWNRKLDTTDIVWLQANSINSLINPVPEPASAGLLLLGLIGLARYRRKRLTA